MAADPCGLFDASKPLTAYDNPTLEDAIRKLKRRQDLIQNVIDAREPVNLNDERASRQVDSREWTLTDCLQSLLRENKTAKWDKALIVLSHTHTGMLELDSRIVGCTTLEARGLLMTEIKHDINNR